MDIICNARFLCIEWSFSEKMLPFFGGWLKPVPAPDSTNELDNNKTNEGGNNQKEILFNRGNAMSGLNSTNKINWRAISLQNLKFLLLSFIISI